MTRAKVRECVSQVETQQWAGRAAAKPALHFYVAHKREIRCASFYDDASGEWPSVRSVIWDATNKVVAGVMWDGGERHL
ncbi:hypothetical protein HPB48_015537 [Haemaphysalis longicornis]|uniref:Uncharacterized protein n=1 Tax=Haemaphysalis longicornis TaxID=44386 RepID=A0A9J6FHQ7_HAELO|nr:hypothetical protein HPB48_015537 [Haemaphysalis longicornis]